ncbi:MAG TPA: type II CAAX endopeptidase family protein [Chloroflexia bacterium]|nr:type II CAAX endopeptidase family protein [Chloroflexia bacterium]
MANSISKLKIQRQDELVRFNECGNLKPLPDRESKSRFSNSSQTQKSEAATARGVLAYLLLAFGFAWVLWVPVWLTGLKSSSPLYDPAFLGGALAPGLAAIVVRRWITREGFGDAGWQLHLKRKWPYYLIAGLWPFFILLGAVDLAVMLGFPVRTEAFGSILPALPGFLVLTPFFWGEEFGWRSYLQLRLFGSRPLLAALATGLIWGVWHYPAVLAGYLPNEHGLPGVLLYAWYMIPHSIILGWLRLRSGSIWVPTLAHLANNTIGPVVLSALLISGG